MGDDDHFVHGMGHLGEQVARDEDRLAETLDFDEIDPNPVRDARVKLPKERKAHIPPPLAEHVEHVAERLPRHHVLPFLVIDECGPRVSELETAQVGDLDRRAIRVRWTVEKNDRYRHLELPDDLFAAIVQRLAEREDAHRLPRNRPLDRARPRRLRRGTSVSASCDSWS